MFIEVKVKRVCNLVADYPAPPAETRGAGRGVQRGRPGGRSPPWAQGVRKLYEGDGVRRSRASSLVWNYPSN